MREGGGRKGGKEATRGGGEMSEEGNMGGREGGKEKRRIRNRGSSSIEQMHHTA